MQESTVSHLPFVFGTIAWWNGKDSIPTKTHHWQVYVRGCSNEDLSYVIRKVVFKLHESFDEPSRVVTKPPFEVNEEGWGEFELSMKVFFVDKNEKPLELFHMLRLFPPSGLLSKKPVVSEVYTEAVFTKPSELIAKQLTSRPQRPPEARVLSHPLAASSYGLYTDFEEYRDLETIAAAHKKVTEQLRTLRQQVSIADEHIAQLGGAPPAAAPPAAVPPAGTIVPPPAAMPTPTTTVVPVPALPLPTTVAAAAAAAATNAPTPMDVDS